MPLRDRDRNGQSGDGPDLNGNLTPEQLDGLFNNHSTLKDINADISLEAVRHAKKNSSKRIEEWRPHVEDTDYVEEMQNRKKGAKLLRTSWVVLSVGGGADSFSFYAILLSLYVQSALPDQYDKIADIISVVLAVFFGTATCVITAFGFVLLLESIGADKKKHNPGSQQAQDHRNPLKLAFSLLLLTFGVGITVLSNAYRVNMFVEAGQFDFIAAHQQAIKFLLILTCTGLAWTAGILHAYGSQARDSVTAQYWDLIKREERIVEDAELQEIIIPKQKARSKIDLQNRRFTYAPPTPVVPKESNWQRILAIGVGVLVVLLLIFLFASGAAAAASDSIVPGTRTVIIMDASSWQSTIASNGKTFFENARSGVASLLNNVQPSDSVTAIAVSDFGTPNVILPRHDITCLTDRLGQRIKKARQSLVTDWEKASASAPPLTKESRIIETFWTASEILGPCPPKKCTIYAYTDLREYNRASHIDMDTPAVIDAEKIFELLKRKGFIPRLNNTDIYVAGMGAVSGEKSLEFWTSLRATWTRWLKESGANLIYMSPLFTLPADANAK